MSKLSELKSRDTDRQRICGWLDRIGETDTQCRDEVLAECTRNIEARKYYVMRSQE